jgi:hypothetical protein
VTFATKPELARAMIGRPVELGLPFAWFTADEAYGDNGKLRKWLEEVPARGWQRMSCGPGSKGERLYDGAISPTAQGRHLLIRGSLTSGELAFCLCWSPAARRWPSW